MALWLNYYAASNTAASHTLAAHSPSPTQLRCIVHSVSNRTLSELPYCCAMPLSLPAASILPFASPQLPLLSPPFITAPLLPAVVAACSRRVDDITIAVYPPVSCDCTDNRQQLRIVDRRPTTSSTQTSTLPTPTHCRLLHLKLRLSHCTPTTPSHLLFLPSYLPCRPPPISKLRSSTTTPTTSRSMCRKLHSPACRLRAVLWPPR